MKGVDVTSACPTVNGEAAMTASQRENRWFATVVGLLLVAACGAPISGRAGKGVIPSSPSNVGTPSSTPVTSGGGTATTPPSSGSGTATSTPVPNGGGGGNGGNGLPSPIRVPIPADGLCCGSYAMAKPRLEAEIREACGHNELCIQVVMVVDEGPDNDSLECETVHHVAGFQYDESRKYIEVDRGGAIGIVVNYPCGEGPPSSLEEQSSPGQ